MVVLFPFSYNIKYSLLYTFICSFILKGGDFVSVEITAVKKRGRESISGDSEKVNHNMNGMESPQKDGIKKPKVSVAAPLYGSKLNLLIRFLAISISPLLELLLFVETKKPVLVHEASFARAHN